MRVFFPSLEESGNVISKIHTYCFSTFVAYELVHCDNPDIEEAEKYVNKAAEKILASNPHCDLSFFLYYYLVLGRIEHLKGDHHRAEMFYHAALSAIYRTGLRTCISVSQQLSDILMIYY